MTRKKNFLLLFYFYFAEQFKNFEVFTSSWCPSYFQPFLPFHFICRRSRRLSLYSAWCQTQPLTFVYGLCLWHTQSWPRCFGKRWDTIRMHKSFIEDRYIWLKEKMSMTEREDVYDTCNFMILWYHTYFLIIMKIRSYSIVSYTVLSFSSYVFLFISCPIALYHIISYRAASLSIVLFYFILTYPIFLLLVPTIWQSSSWELSYNRCGSSIFIMLLVPSCPFIIFTFSCLLSVTLLSITLFYSPFPLLTIFFKGDGLDDWNQ